MIFIDFVILSRNIIKPFIDEKLKTKKLLVTCLNNNKICGKNHKFIVASFLQ